MRFTPDDTTVATQQEQPADEQRAGPLEAAGPGTFVAATSGAGLLGAMSRSQTNSTPPAARNRTPDMRNGGSEPTPMRMAR